MSFEFVKYLLQRLSFPAWELGYLSKRIELFLTNSTPIRYVQARKELCENFALKAVGAEHCFLLVEMKNGIKLKVDRGGGLLCHIKQTTEEIHGKSLFHRETTGGSFVLLDLIRKGAESANVKYRLVKDNCFWFVAKLMNELGMPPRLVDLVYKANDQSVGFTVQQLPNAVREVIALKEALKPPVALGNSMREKLTSCLK